MTSFDHPATYATPEYVAWRKMIARCENPRHAKWANFGGSGIRVCEAWKDFDTFRDDMGPRPLGHVLSRRDSAGHYTPENCYWERREEACRRYRSTLTVAYGGETLDLTEWSRRTGVAPHTIRARLTVYGWSAGQALGFEPRSSTERRHQPSYPKPLRVELQPRT